MKRSTINLWVGLFVIGGFIALMLLAFKVANLASGTVKDGYRVTAHFEDIGGLRAQAPVRSAGVLVGRVAAIDFDTKKYNAAVTLILDKKYPFPMDTSASILTSGILGEQYIGLDAGGDENNLKDGDTLTLTQSAVVLEKVISQFLFSKASEGAKPQQAQ